MFNIGSFACTNSKMSHQYHRTSALVSLSPITEMWVSSQRVLCFQSLIHVCWTATLWHPTRAVRHDRLAYTIPQPGPSGSSFCIWPITWLASLRSPDILSDFRTYLPPYILNFLLTAWCRVFLEKLPGSQLVKKLPAFYGTREFITASYNKNHIDALISQINFCPSSGVYHCTHSKGISHRGLLAACEQLPSWSCSQAVTKPVWHIPLLCVRWKTPDDGQRNCPKHVEFYSKINLRN